MITDPFHTRYEYPEADHILEGPKVGHLFEYVSATYLNGLINYVKPVRAWMAKRYRPSGHAEAVAAITAETIESGGRQIQRFHTDLRGKGMPVDDIVIIATSHEGSRVWLFYFDCDVSDCMIGCTDASVDDVVAFATDPDYGIGAEIDPARLTGWIKF